MSDWPDSLSSPLPAHDDCCGCIMLEKAPGEDFYLAKCNECAKTLGVFAPQEIWQDESNRADLVKIGADTYTPSDERIAFEESHPIHEGNFKVWYEDRTFYFFPIFHSNSITWSHSQGYFYELDMLNDIRQRVGPGAVFVDAGANVGNHSIFFAEICEAKAVYAFEADKMLLDILAYNVLLNCWERPEEKIKIFWGVLSNGVGNAVVVGGHVMNRCFEHSEEGMPTISLDTLELSETVDVLKIDVEGMEADVLRGAEGLLRRDRPRWIYVECQTPETTREVQEFLQELDYKYIQRFNATPTYLFSLE